MGSLKTTYTERASKETCLSQLCYWAEGGKYLPKNLNCKTVLALACILNSHHQHGLKHLKQRIKLKVKSRVGSVSR